MLPLALGLAGCTTVKAVPEPARFIAGTQPQKVWITQTDGTTLQIGAPRVVGDTMFGFLGTEFQEIPMHSITEVRAVRSAPGRTVALATAFALTAGVAYYEMNKKGGSGSVNCTGNEEDIC